MKRGRGKDSYFAALGFVYKYSSTWGVAFPKATEPAPKRWGSGDGGVGEHLP